MTRLIAPHGGTLRELLLDPETRDSERRRALDYPSWGLTRRQLCDLELLMNGGFSPLSGFMVKADYERVCTDMRLADDTLWPMPVVLDVSEAFAGEVDVGGRVALRDPEGVLLAVLEVEDLWRPDRALEARQVFATEDDAHPGVRFLRQTNPVYLGGRVLGVEPPMHYDFKGLRYTPRQLRDTFERLGWRRVAGFQTRNPMHRAHREITARAARIAEANLLIHPSVGMTQPGDIDHFTRVRCYEHLLETYPDQTTLLALLPLAMRMGGPREALWHAIIRKNHGCTHFIVGWDHAGPDGRDDDRPFYEPYEAQALVRRHQDEIEVEMVPFQDMVYVPQKGGYMPADEADENDTLLRISGGEFRRRLREGRDIPDWFSYPKVVAELRRTYPPRHRQGFTVFFTGLSGAGKSTIANALVVKLLEMGGRPVTLLDGDIVRQNLSSELGFSRQHRDLNILRIGFVASEITKNGGIAICAPIAPYRETRHAVREMIEEGGGFIEAYVATPLSVCEARDRKGLYAKARAGIIKGFTGIDDPYEEPEAPEIRLDTQEMTADEAAQTVVLKLESLGFIR